MKKGLGILLAIIMVIAVSTVAFAWEADCMYGTPIIDGDIDNIWSYTETITMNPVPTLGGTCKVLWDESYMYYLFEMQDDAQFAMSFAEGNDSVEVWVDEGDLDQDHRNDIIGNNDFHYRVDIDGTVSSNENSTSDCTAALDYTDTTYTVEFRVPYHSITPSVGYVMGFTPSANSDDDGDGDRDVHINNNDGIYWDIPAHYDDLLFVNNPLSISSVTADLESPQPVDSWIRWTCDATGNELEYEWDIYKDDIQIGTQSYGSNNYIDYYATSAGVYKVEAYVKDIYGTVISDYSELITIEAPPPTELVINSLTADKTSPQPVSTAIKWTCDADGDGLVYGWYLYKDGVRIEANGYGSNNYFDYTPSTEGAYKVKVYVKDQYGAVLSQYSELMIIGDQVPTELAINSLTADKTSPQPVSTAIKWTCDADGDGLVYGWYLYQDGVRIEANGYGSNNYFDYTPATEGAYKVKVYVKDQYGAVLSQYSELMIIGDQVPTELAINSLTADKESPQATDTLITWTCDADGDGLVYGWYLYQGGTRIDVQGYGSDNYLEYTPTLEGIYKVKVYVKDQYGAVLSQYSEEITISND